MIKTAPDSARDVPGDALHDAARVTPQVTAHVEVDEVAYEPTYEPAYELVPEENQDCNGASCGADDAGFYRDLPVLSSFTEAMDSRLHRAVPPDWWIVVADVAGSTEAIAAGAYKQVNTVGVACIAAVTNVDRGLDLPFVFGGDGATIAVPDRLREGVIAALRGAQRMARDGFGLSLRAGLVRVGDLAREDFPVRLGKVRLSSHVTQPVFSGNGWQEAERRLKARDASGVIRVAEDGGPAQANFDGFECRWKNVPSFHGHKLALLAIALTTDARANLAIYQSLFERIQAIYGDVAQYHPLHADSMRMSFTPAALANELTVRAGRGSPAQRLKYMARMLLLNLAGKYLIARKIRTEETDWGGYPGELVENSDFRKFDGMLRMVIDGSDDQAQRLQVFLEEEHRAGRLAYGMHKSREALVTCIVRSYTGNHLHFVDGSDGGYALAAHDLKRRLPQGSLRPSDQKR